MATDLELLKRLGEIAAAYGPNPERWPKGERSLIEEAARRHPEALGEAHEIDRVLALASAPPKSPGGQARLIEAIAGKSQGGAKVVPMPFGKRREVSPGWSWAAVATLAASLACGIYLGTLDSTSVLLDPAGATSDDPVDLAGLGDLSDYIEGDG